MRCFPYTIRLEEKRLELIGVAVSKSATLAKHYCEIDPECDLNSLYRIKKQHSQPFIENVKRHHLSKVSTCPETVIYHDSRGGSGSVRNNASVPKWVPISTETIVANALQAGSRGSFIRDFHASRANQLDLIDNRKVWLDITRACQGLYPKKESRPLRKRAEGPGVLTSLCHNSRVCQGD